MRMVRIRQIDFNKAPDAVRHAMMYNQFALKCPYKLERIFYWIEEILNPWMDNNIVEGFYSIDLINGYVEDYNDQKISFGFNDYDMITRKITNDDAAHAHYLIVRLSNPQEADTFAHQCVFWKLSN